MPTPQEVDEALLAPFAQHIDAPRVPLLYRLGLLLVGLLMILLPLVYLGILVAIACGVGWYVVTVGRLTKGVTIWHMGPPIAGLVTLIFMARPLFRRRPKDPVYVRLHREDEPLLFDFLGRLCQLLHCPRPRRIVVNCQANAGARLRRGIWSLPGGWGLELEIGLPLAAGLTLRQFAGVLAHELGHLRLSGGMRLGYVIWSINGWFSRVVYEQDVWEKQWPKQLGRGGIVVAPALVLAVCLIWLTRQILWVLMWMGRTASCFLYRQTEIYADAYAVRVTGNEEHPHLQMEVAFLEASYRRVLLDLDRSWRQRELCDDLPDLVTQARAHMPAEVREKIQQAELQRTTGWFDNHPAPTIRIEAAKRHSAEGLALPDVPATRLFADFERLSRSASLRFYEERLGSAFEPEALLPSAVFYWLQNRRELASQSLGRVFGNQVILDRPLCSVPLSTAQVDRASVVQQLTDLRQQIQELLPTQTDAVKRLVAANDRFLRARQVLALHAARFKRIKGSTFGMQRGDQEEATAIRQQASQEIEKACGIIDRFNALALAWLQAALGVAASADLTDEDRQYVGPSNHASVFLRTLEDLGGIYPLFWSLYEDQIALRVLHHNRRIKRRPWRLHRHIRPLAEQCSRKQHELWACLAERPYPLPTSQPLSLAQYLIGPLPPTCRVELVLATCARIVERTCGLYYRSLGELVLVAEMVERALGVSIPVAPVQTEAPASADTPSVCG